MCENVWWNDKQDTTLHKENIIETQTEREIKEEKLIKKDVCVCVREREEVEYEVVWCAGC